MVKNKRRVLMNRWHHQLSNPSVHEVYWKKKMKQKTKNKNYFSDYKSRSVHDSTIYIYMAYIYIFIYCSMPLEVYCHSGYMYIENNLKLLSVQRAEPGYFSQLTLLVLLGSRATASCRSCIFLLSSSFSTILSGLLPRHIYTDISKHIPKRKKKKNTSLY